MICPIDKRVVISASPNNVRRQEHSPFVYHIACYDEIVLRNRSKELTRNLRNILYGERVLEVVIASAAHSQHLSLIPGQERIQCAQKPIVEKNISVGVCKEGHIWTCVLDTLEERKKYWSAVGICLDRRLVQNIPRPPCSVWILSAKIKNARTRGRSAPYIIAVF